MQRVVSLGVPPGRTSGPVPVLLVQTFPYGNQSPRYGVGLQALTPVLSVGIAQSVPTSFFVAVCTQRIHAVCAGRMPPSALAASASLALGTPWPYPEESVEC